MADLISITKKQMQGRATQFVLLVGVVSFLPTSPMKAPAALQDRILQSWERVPRWSVSLPASGNSSDMVYGWFQGGLANAPANSGRLLYSATSFQMSAVPLLALAPNWQIAGLLIVS